MSARTMLIIAGTVATARWTAMGFNPSLEVLILLQLTHGITYPFSYFGLMHFIANWAPEEIAAEAQGFAWTLTQAASVLTLILFGWLIGVIGGQSYFVAAVMAVVAVGGTWWSFTLKPAHKDEPDLGDAAR
jgi:PPP family 3-phenylpropionic acid transporter